MISINLTIKQKGVIIVCIIENKFAIHKKSSDVKGLNLNYTSSKFNSFGRPYLQKKAQFQTVPYNFCREEGIRTLDTFPYTRVPGVRLRPLGHLSI